MNPLSGISPSSLFHVFLMLHSLDIRKLWGGELQGGVRIGGRKRKVAFA